MAISSTLTAGQIVNQAIVLIGAKDSRSTLTSEDRDLGLLQLNWMLKSWQAAGCNLWRRTEDSIVIPADTATVTLDPYCIDVQEARLQISDDPLYERWIERWEWGQYVTMPNKLASGQPTCFVLDKQRAAVTMTVWPVPSEAMTINYTYARVIEDIVDQNSVVDVPQAWLEAVYYSLANRLLTPFSVWSTQPAEATKIEAMAERLYKEVLDMDRPQSVYLQPWQATPYDMRGRYGY